MRTIVGTVLVAGLVLALCGRRPPLLVLAAVAVVGVVVAEVARVRARRRLDRWAEDQGWVTVDTAGRDWPWHGLLVSGAATVGRAWIRETDGMPVTFGEVRWTGAAFGGAVLSAVDSGLFVVVRLPVAAPPMAVRLPYLFLGDSPRLELPALRDAFLRGDIPPWTVPGNVLFTVEPVTGRPGPPAVERVVSRALSVVRLLDLGPDRGQ